MSQPDLVPSAMPPAFGVRERWGIIFTLTLLFVWTLSPLAGYDFWFYVAVGRQIVETSELPWAQTYLGTTSGLGFGRYADVAWLANVICYGIFAAAGPLGLVLLKSALLCATTFLVYLSNRLAGLAPFWAGAWSALALWTIRGRFEMRTYLFSDLALATLVLLLVAFERDGNSRRTGLGLALLFAVWTNLHQGVIAGFVVLGCWMIFGRRPWKTRLALTALAGVSNLVRPHPLSLPAFLYDHFANTSAISGVVEWASPGAQVLIYQLGLFYLCLLLGVAVGWREHRRRKSAPPWAFGLTALMFALMALRSLRSISEILPVVCPLAAAYLPRDLPVGKAQKMAGFLLLALFVGTFHPSNLRGLTKASGYPSELVDAFDPKTGQLFNSFEFGNYLVYRDVPPFLHGITGLYQEQLISDFEAVLNPTSRRQEILEKYNVQAFLLHLPEANDATLNLVDTLAESPDWKLELWDDTGLLFLRGPRGDGLTHFRPWRTPAWTNAAAAERELLELVKRRPSAIAHRTLSQLALERGDLDGATEQARLAVEHSPYYYAAWAQLGLCYARAGNLEGVLEASAKGVRAGDGGAAARFNRALALVEQAKRESGLPSWWHTWQAKYQLRRALWLDPGFAPARGLSDQL